MAMVVAALLWMCAKRVPESSRNQSQVRVFMWPGSIGRSTYAQDFHNREHRIAGRVLKSV